MPRLALYLLGPPRIELDSQLIILDTRKGVALLAALAVGAGLQTRDALAAFLWPEYDTARAKAALRRTLSALKREIGSRHLLISRAEIGLDPRADLWVDVAAFDQAVAAGRLDEAAALYRDDFMAGFGLRDSLAFDDWQLAETESRRRQYAGILARLIPQLLARDDMAGAIAHAWRWLQLDPLHEEAHRQLMRLHAWAGQRNEALHQYRECVRILDEELGVAPLPETTALYQAIKEGRLEEQPAAALAPPAERPLAAPTPAQSRPAAGQLPALIGREEAWRALDTLYQAAGPGGRLAAVVGEAGIGKTRLIEEWGQAQSGQGSLVLAARAYAGEEELAYSLFAEALRDGLGQPGRLEALAEVPALWLAEAGRLLPELLARFPQLPPAPPLEDPGNQSRFFEGIRRVLAALLHGPRPGVLCFDDLQFADSASLDLLTYLARRLAGLPCFLLVTWREEQLPPAHRLRLLLAELGRQGVGQVVPLPRWGEAEVAQMVQAWSAAQGVAAPVPASLPAQLFRESEGIPFFVVEYLSAWQPGDPAWQLPPSVRDLLAARLAALDEASRQLLQTAAVIGRSFDFDTLRTASGRSDEEAVAGLERLITLGMALERGADDPARLRYDFSHEKLRALAYEQTTLARRRLLHRRVAEALQAGSRESQGQAAPQIAYHCWQAGQETAAARYYWLAGNHARSVYAHSEALSHFRRALALGYPDTAALHEAMGDVATLLGDYEEARQRYETAAALARNGALARLEHRLGLVQQRQGDHQAAESHFAAARAAWDGQDAVFLAHLLVDWSRAAHGQGDPERALDLAQQALSLVDGQPAGEALGECHNMLGMIYRTQGRQTLAAEHLAASLEAAQSPAARIAALNNLALLAGRQGDLERALALLEEALALCQGIGDRHREAALQSNMADVLHAAGQKGEAQEHVKASALIYREIGGRSGWQPEIWKLVEW